MKMIIPLSLEFMKTSLQSNLREQIFDTLSLQNYGGMNSDWSISGGNHSLT
jgi:hypothetical protein